MKKTYLISLLIIIAVAAVIIYMLWPKPIAKEMNPTVVPVSNEMQNPPASKPTQDIQNNNQNNQTASSFQPPLDRVAERVTKKPFGIYITPKTSPVQPERFQGYHTGTDFETFPDEQNIDVPVHAVCSGNLLMKKYASGYGGVAVQFCQADNQPITVIYGHLNLASTSPKVGDNLNVGDVIGNLGTGYSAQTDGERKHLHLGFHKGSSISILGYVNSQNQLSGWLDPCQYVCGK